MHANIETELACGNCGKAVCPRCLIQTPAGQRCRACARLRRPPMYELGPLLLGRAVLAATAVGLLAGGVWAFVPRLLGFFIFLLAVGLGYVMAEAIGRATNRKRGYSLQLIAGFGIVLAYLTRNVIGAGVLFIPSDIFGFIAVVIAIVVAVNPLR